MAGLPACALPWTEVSAWAASTRPWPGSVELSPGVCTQGWGQGEALSAGGFPHCEFTPLFIKNIML